MLRKKMSKSDLKLRILTIVIITIALILIFTLISSPWPKDSNPKYHWEIPILDEDGKEIRGVHLFKFDPVYKLEDISIVIINLTSSLCDYECPTNRKLECTNTSYAITYVNDGDKYFDDDDYMLFYGSTEGCILKFVHKTEKTIAEVRF